VLFFESKNPKHIETTVKIAKNRLSERAIMRCARCLTLAMSGARPLASECKLHSIALVRPHRHLSRRYRRTNATAPAAVPASNETSRATTYRNLSRSKSGECVETMGRSTTQHKQTPTKTTRARTTAFVSALQKTEPDRRGMRIRRRVASLFV
jgi:hypothetical protein